MAMFFKAPAAGAEFKSALETALRVQPETVRDFDEHASAMAALVQAEMPKARISWARLGIAAAMLAVLAGLGIWSAGKPELAEWSKMFLHSFEMLFGGVIGLLGVEAASS